MLDISTLSETDKDEIVSVIAELEDKNSIFKRKIDPRTGYYTKEINSYSLCEKWETLLREWFQFAKKDLLHDRGREIYYIRTDPDALYCKKSLGTGTFILFGLKHYFDEKSASNYLRDVHITVGELKSYLDEIGLISKAIPDFNDQMDFFKKKNVVFFEGTSKNLTADSVLYISPIITLIITPERNAALTTYLNHMLDELEDLPDSDIESDIDLTADGPLESDNENESEELTNEANSQNK